MRDLVISYLENYKRSIITLDELESLFNGDTTYESFALCISELIDEGILEEVNAKNNTGKSIPLAYKFRIKNHGLRKNLIDKVQELRLQVSSKIDLEAYLSLPEEELKKDIIYIKKINEYILKEKLPINNATSQERSFHIVADEKWIDEKDGKKILERIKLWDMLKIVNASEPLMLAVNPNQFQRIEYNHLIVENKATFYGLLDALKETNCTSLIFGSGWKVVANISMIERQLGLNGKHNLYYFGDLDYEGISIWNSLDEKISVNLAVEFYRELFKKPYSFGKVNQDKNKKALNNFLNNFNIDEQSYIEKLLLNKGYYPQEGLNKVELQRVWRNATWA